MYNFGVPVQLKTWIDAIAKAGTTFRYTEQGPEGLIKGKKVYVALARGGIYRDTPADSQVPYLKAVLGFVGMTDVEFIYAEGLAMGAESADKGFTAAEAEIAERVG
jgi:FMN-dependent NADH-azoreductase